MTGALASIPSPPPSWSSLQVAGVTFHPYALFVLAAIVVAAWVTDRRLVARGAPRGQVLDVVVWAVPLGIVGARLAHIITSPGEFFGPGGSPLRALFLWSGGLEMWGALLLGGAGVWIGCRRADVAPTAFLDAAAPGLLVAVGVARFGSWFNQDLVGRPTGLPWGLEISPALRPAAFAEQTAFHPLSLYEAAWVLVAAVLVLVWERRAWRVPGTVFLAAATAYALGRLWIDPLRAEASAQVLGLPLAVVVSLLVAVLGVAGLALTAAQDPGSAGGLPQAEQDVPEPAPDAGADAVPAVPGASGADGVEEGRSASPPGPAWSAWAAAVTVLSAPRTSTGDLPALPGPRPAEPPGDRQRTPAPPPVVPDRADVDDEGAIAVAETSTRTPASQDGDGRGAPAPDQSGPPPQDHGSAAERADHERAALERAQQEQSEAEAEADRAAALLEEALARVEVTAVEHDEAASRHTEAERLWDRAVRGADAERQAARAAVVEVERAAQERAAERARLAQEQLAAAESDLAEAREAADRAGRVMEAAEETVDQHRQALEAVQETAAERTAADASLRRSAREAEEAEEEESARLAQQAEDLAERTGQARSRSAAAEAERVEAERAAVEAQEAVEQLEAERFAVLDAAGRAERAAAERAAHEVERVEVTAVAVHEDLAEVERVRTVLQGAEVHRELSYSEAQRARARAQRAADDMAVQVERAASESAGGEQDEQDQSAELVVARHAAALADAAEDAAAVVTTERDAALEAAGAAEAAAAAAVQERELAEQTFARAEQALRERTARAAEQLQVERSAAQQVAAERFAARSAAARRAGLAVPDPPEPPPPFFGTVAPADDVTGVVPTTTWMVPVVPSAAPVPAPSALVEGPDVDDEHDDEHDDGFDHGFDDEHDEGHAPQVPRRRARSWLAGRFTDAARRLEDRG